MNFADDVMMTAGEIARQCRDLAREVMLAKQALKNTHPEAAGRLNIVQASLLVVNTDCGALVSAVRTAVTTRQIPAEAAVRVADHKMAAANDTEWAPLEPQLEPN